jgi:hypothetical protein
MTWRCNRIVGLGSGPYCRCCVPGERASLTGSWVGHTADLGVVAKRKIAAPNGNLIPAMQPLVDHFKGPYPTISIIVISVQNM